ncbi:MAG: tyrosine-type recombinase/integrase [Roseiflexaceae bacterium]|jgi:integrase/recombinase XerD|nr:tyrosine-type recombinase/integrase [Chloroflexaceae bacterium]
MAYTFAQALIDWQLNQQRRRRPLSPATIASYGDAWHSFMHWAHANQRHDVADITATDVADWLNTLTRHADGSVLTYSHGALAICRFLADRKLLSCDVSLIAMHASDARPRTTPSRAPDVADLRRLVSFYDHELPAGPIQSKAERMRLSQLRNAALLHLLFSTASRISEVLALDTSDLKGDHGMLANRVSVIGKGDKRRTVFVRPHARTALERYLLARRASFPHATALFISHGPRGAGHRLNRIAAWGIVTHAALTLADTVAASGKLAEARLLRDTTPHTFRHFVAMWLLNEGVQLSEVSAILGHASTRITEQYYARHTDSRLAEVHDQFAADPLAE